MLKTTMNQNVKHVKLHYVNLSAVVDNIHSHTQLLKLLESQN